MNVPQKTLVTDSPRSLIAKLTINFNEENTRLTDKDDTPRQTRLPLILILFGGILQFNAF